MRKLEFLSFSRLEDHVEIVDTETILRKTKDVHHIILEVTNYLADGSEKERETQREVKTYLM